MAAAGFVVDAFRLLMRVLRGAVVWGRDLGLLLWVVGQWVLRAELWVLLLPLGVLGVLELLLLLLEGHLVQDSLLLPVRELVPLRMVPRHAVLLDDSHGIRRLHKVPFVGVGSFYGLREGESFVAWLAVVSWSSFADLDLTDELWDETHDWKALGQVSRALLISDGTNRGKEEIEALGNGS